MPPKNPGLIPYTFKDTGKSVLIRKVSPLLIMELSKAFPAPKPPLQKVDYGDGKEHLEPNPASPDYLQALQEYNMMFQERMQILMVKRGVEITLSPEDKAEIQELRDFWQKEYGKTLDPDDRMVYVLNLCVGSDADLEELLTAISRRSQPTEPAIQESLDNFKSRVS